MQVSHMRRPGYCLVLQRILEFSLLMKVTAMMVMVLVGLWPPITILYDETHIVVELNSPVLLLGMFENFTPGLKIVICKTIVEKSFMK